MAHHRNLREFSCSECSRTFNTKADLTQHFKIHKISPSANPYCLICRQQCASEQELKSHMQSQHGVVSRERKAEEFIFTCGDCGLTPVTRLREHYQTHHPQIADFKCSQCLVRFLEPQFLKRHFQKYHMTADGTVTAQVDNRVQCGICGIYVVSIASHVKTVHEKIKNYKCPLCDKTFNKSSGLSRHVNGVHEKKKQFECPICQKGFHDKSYLYKHIKFHGDKKTSKYRLVVSQKHQDPNHCFICRIDVEDMRDHFKTVHPDSKFECKICFRSYPRKESLRRHQNAFHVKNPVKYTCDHCGKSYVDKDNIRKHMYYTHFNQLTETAVKMLYSENKRKLTRKEIIAIRRNERKAQELAKASKKMKKEPPPPVAAKKKPDAVVKKNQPRKAGRFVRAKRKSTKKVSESITAPEPEKIENQTDQTEKIKSEDKSKDDSNDDDFQTFDDPTPADDDHDEPVKIKEEVASDDDVYVASFPAIYLKEEELSADEIEDDNGDDAGDTFDVTCDDRLNDSDSSEDNNTPIQATEPSVAKKTSTETKEVATEASNANVDQTETSTPKVSRNSLSCDCPLYFNNEESFERHKKQLHMPWMKVKCDFCVKEFATATMQRIHIRQSHKGQLPFSCKECNLRIRDSHGVHNHNARFHPEKCSREQIQERTCEHCNTIYNTAQHKKNHMLAKHSQKMFSCNICHTEFSYKRALQRHEKSQHKDVKFFSCDFCGDRFESKVPMMEHMLSQHVLNPVRKYQCLLCTDAFYSVHTLKVHDYEVHIKKPDVKPRQKQTHCICKYCGEDCKRDDKRRRHYVKVHENGDKPMRECLICQKKVKLYSIYLAHIKSHNIEHMCLVCSYPCETASELLRHTQDHRKVKDEYKKFICETCGRPHFSLSQLKIHMRTHTGDRPYVCETCGQSFKFGSVYFYHKRKAHRIDGNQFVSLYIVVFLPHLYQFKYSFSRSVKHAERLSTSETIWSFINELILARTHTFVKSATKDSYPT